ncbi:MAG: FAD-dependent oxidoreductase [Oscillospiraceae bacterium]|nr:FAD-dependent oxidoreductase [Oscillospiraceae bacterium]
MKEINLIINGIEAKGFDNQTILEVAQNCGVEIPTLCHDERVKMYGACGICTVEIEGSPRLFRSCSALAADGMMITTDSQRIRKNRQTALELLLSDHKGDCRPPCMLACPAETDCMGYVNLIAQGNYNDALKLIMEKIPLPASIGRVCPHPCEDGCRRELVEEPIAIAQLKQFVGDLSLNESGGIERDNTTIPLSGMAVAVIGGGPGGLSAAYFLRLKGHAVTVFDAMPEMGGMLRYGIPEYRLPKALLQKEIDFIKNTGVKMRNNVRICADTANTLNDLRKEFDAVIIAAGAWSDLKLRCKGEDLNGVMGGIKFLLEVATGHIKQGDFEGKKIAVVGGGNTAMDACRTAVRLGTEKVYNIYRRTKNEMPAEEIEILEAEEEGVIFKNLTNPNEIVGGGEAPAGNPSSKTVTSIRLQVMELGEPDASGRRAPVPVEGKEEVLDVDMVIAAIGQKLNPGGFEALELTSRGTINADENMFTTNLDGVFAIGDAVNKGADIAVSAIGQAKKAAEAVNKYLYGEELNPPARYLVKDEKTAEDFKDREKQARVKMPHRSGNERKADFKEINLGLSEEAAKKEASRCLECGCKDYFDCKLIKYANQYEVKPEKYECETCRRTTEQEIPDIIQNPNKCVLCGLCVRLCEEDVGAGVLGFVNRGFDTTVRAAGDITKCADCGKCAEVCPTGALMKANQA